MCLFHKRITSPNLVAVRKMSVCVVSPIFGLRLEAKVRRGHTRSLKIYTDRLDRLPTYDFLLVIHSNYELIYFEQFSK